jgi:hypothetical protein
MDCDAHAINATQPRPPQGSSMHLTIAGVHWTPERRRWRGRQRCPSAGRSTRPGCRSDHRLRKHVRSKAGTRRCSLSLSHTQTCRQQIRFYRVPHQTRSPHTGDRGPPRSAVPGPSLVKGLELDRRTLHPWPPTPTHHLLGNDPLVHQHVRVVGDGLLQDTQQKKPKAHTDSSR